MNDPESISGEVVISVDSVSVDGDAVKKMSITLNVNYLNSVVTASVAHCVFQKTDDHDLVD